MTHESPLGRFDPIDGVWLNTAHQGVLPAAAAEEAREAVAWKQSPFELTQDRFDGVPRRLRVALGRLLCVPPEEVILANSASYGLHLIANAFPWHDDDEVVVMDGDFPSDILPWLLAERERGISVVRVRPRARVISPDELRTALTPRTRLFCITWVHSFSGYTVDLDELGQICRKHGVVFVVNGSQGIGARPLDLSSSPVDALTSVGFKWLCGPYGAGLCWIRPELRTRLRPQKAYWLAQSSAEELASDLGAVQLRPPSTAAAWDVFGTANFFVFKPFAAAVEHVLEVGLDHIHAHNQNLVDRFISRLRQDRYTIKSPREPGPRRSTLVFFSHRDPARAADIHASLCENRIWTALRAGQLRLSPHLHNSMEDIDQAVTLLNKLA